MTVRIFISNNIISLKKVINTILGKLCINFNESFFSVNVETKLIPELFGCLWVPNKKLKVSTFELILERAMLPHLRPIVQQLMLKDNAVVPLISNVIDKNCDINLLSLTLTVLKYICYDCKSRGLIESIITIFGLTRLICTAQPLMTEFSQIGGVEAAKRLVEFLSNPEPRVQAGALELVGVFIKGTLKLLYIRTITETNLTVQYDRPYHGTSVATSRFVSSNVNSVQERSSCQQIVRVGIDALFSLS